MCISCLLPSLFIPYPPHPTPAANLYNVPELQRAMNRVILFQLASPTTTTEGLFLSSIVYPLFVCLVFCQHICFSICVFVHVFQSLLYLFLHSQSFFFVLFFDHVFQSLFDLWCVSLDIIFIYQSINQPTNQSLLTCHMHSTRTNWPIRHTALYIMTRNGNQFSNQTLSHHFN